MRIIPAPRSAWILAVNAIRRGIKRDYAGSFSATYGIFAVSSLLNQRERSKLIPHNPALSRTVDPGTLLAILVGPIAVKVEQGVSRPVRARARDGIPGAVRAHARGGIEFLEAVREGTGGFCQALKKGAIGADTSRLMRPISCARHRVRSHGPILFDGGLMAGATIALCPESRDRALRNQRISKRRRGLAEFPQAWARARAIQGSGLGRPPATSIRIFRSRRARVVGFGDDPKITLTRLGPAPTFPRSSRTCAPAHWWGSDPFTKVERNSHDRG